LFSPPSPNCWIFQTCGEVSFGDAAGSIIYESSDDLLVVAPPHAAGTVDISLSLPTGGLTPKLLTLKNAFTYEDPGNTTVRLLLPVAAGTQGILNTSWQTDVLAHNETTSPVVIAGTTIPPLTTQKLALSPASTGMFLQIPRSVFEGVTITTHVHDTTHDAESLGVDVPSVPETQFRPTVVLTGVPNDGRYRILLRAYGYLGVFGFLVRVRDDSTGELLVSTQSPVIVASDLTYLQMPISAPQTSHTLRVEVWGGTPIWAFLTLTNNTTENVTLITPSVAIAPEAPSLGPIQGHWAHAGNCMEVTNNTVASVSYNGCTFGSFDFAGIYPDGHFDVGGTVTHGGAVQPPEPARFSGLLNNGTIALTIKTATQTIGPFTLIFGSTEPCTPPCP